jgi:hypothetical protein
VALQEKTHTLEEIRNTNILALKSSNIEYLIPKAFRILFIILIGIAILAIVANWTIITAAPLTVQLTSTVTPVTTPTP